MKGAFIFSIVNQFYMEGVTIMEQIFTAFRDGIKDNDNDNDKNTILSAKDDKLDILCQLITDQVAETNRFSIPDKPFGDDTCKPCSGLGFKILFERVLSVRTCLKCDHGKKIVPCKKCQNGRFIRDKGDLKINVECKFCQGTKSREVKCRTCRGSGELRKMVITPNIKSTTPCKHCRELGFIDEKLFAIIDDTEKFVDAAEQLVDAVFSPTLVEELNLELHEDDVPPLLNAEHENAD
jgi:hypothetical protein